MQRSGRLQRPLPEVAQAESLRPSVRPWVQPSAWLYRLMIAGNQPNRDNVRRRKRKGKRTHTWASDVVELGAA